MVFFKNIDLFIWFSSHFHWVFICLPCFVCDILKLVSNFKLCYKRFMQLWNDRTQPILQLGTDFYDPVQPALFPEKKLRYLNKQIPFDYPLSHLIDFNPLTGNLPQPLALRYHGHQFQNYNPNLGDGWGFLFAQLQNANSKQWYDLGTKGSGTTPYSRAGDGRLTLKGAVREALATEMLESLGVKTSKTLSFFETGENLERNDEPSPTRSAVLTRYSLGHVRIGTFQRLAFFNQNDNLRKLTSYAVHFYDRELSQTLDHDNYPQLAEAFLASVVDKCASLVAQVMMAGFVHGVLNTDNISISGELFDYGPYRFLPKYDPQFTAAYFDREGLYCFGRQPASFLWALHQLGASLKTAYPQFEFEKVLATFSDKFTNYIQIYFLKRLNLKSRGPEENSKLLAEFFQMLSKTDLLFEQAFFDFNSKRILEQPQEVKPNTGLELFAPGAVEFIKLISPYEIADESLAKHSYFQNEKPCTLLIDEIEAIWTPIAENDDWSLFENKLQSIRQMRA